MKDNTSNNADNNINYQKFDNKKVYTDTISESDGMKNPEKYFALTEKTRSINVEKNVSVFDVAAFIIKLMGEMSTMKLQKLVFYCQAWSLVWDEKPLYSEKIEAWANGPVVKELFDYHRGAYIINNISIGNPDCLDSNQKDTVNQVLKTYGDKSAQWLIELTHLEKPWIQARKGLSLNERGNREIAHDAIVEYYSSL